ncbi:hypothetical protein KNU96_gp62 [Xanthomonas phage FoX5]|uniref:Uncharacterized protein n=2 Tax=Foxunavirus TaxID=2948712 RepID=A0A858NWZ3_9CAUD|nr:hypothetical protein KNU93_gp62 [Xanthomonas phage FoX1]YP_010106915.1 hypothetical protein KNU96_gp62 [Xanthomonas phage FoX5]QJB21787.1 hypothetical protein XccvBFoX1_gp48 [Xanthomonas phage FoX1]QJB22028.1 hypothetical protein XccvBFoX5_gp50 [Xanthomonas phage FoX5]
MTRSCLALSSDVFTSVTATCTITSRSTYGPTNAP